MRKTDRLLCALTRRPGERGSDHARVCLTLHSPPLGWPRPAPTPPPADVVLVPTETCSENLDALHIKIITLGADTPFDRPLGDAIYDCESQKEDHSKHDLLGAATTTFRIVLDGSVDGLTLPLRLLADGPPAANVTSHGSVTLMADLTTPRRHTP